MMPPCQSAGLLRLRGGGHVVGDDRVGRVRAGVRGVPDRHHDQSHNGDDQGCSHHEFDHLGTAGVVVKLAQQIQVTSPPFCEICDFGIANHEFGIAKLNCAFATRNSQHLHLRLRDCG